MNSTRIDTLIYKKGFFGAVGIVLLYSRKILYSCQKFKNLAPSNITMNYQHCNRISSCLHFLGRLCSYFSQNSKVSELYFRIIHTYTQYSRTIMGKEVKPFEFRCLSMVFMDENSIIKTYFVKKLLVRILFSYCDA